MARDVGALKVIAACQEGDQDLLERLIRWEEDDLNQQVRRLVDTWDLLAAPCPPPPGAFAPCLATPIPSIPRCRRPCPCPQCALEALSAASQISRPFSC